MCFSFFTTLGVIRVFDNEFPFLTFLNITSLILSLLVMLYTVRDRALNLFLPLNKINYLDHFISILMIGTILVFIILCIFAYFNLISTSLSDSFAIFALGISLSNAWLSEVLINIITTILFNSENNKDLPS